MARVNLFFDLIRDGDIEKIIKNHNIIRLKCAVQFKSKTGWSQPYSAIVDTGAHTSLLPLSIWKYLIYEKSGEYRMFGIAKNDECGIPVEIGKVTCIIVDESGSQTKELNIVAFLAGTDKVPLIIGYKDVLEKINVVSRFSQDIAYVED